MIWTLTPITLRSILAIDASTGQPRARSTAAHSAPINRLLNLGETNLASGDDDGAMKVWDTRQSGACCAFGHHTDFVADMALHDAEQCLVSASGDGTLAVVDLRKQKVGPGSPFHVAGTLQRMRMGHVKLFWPVVPQIAHIQAHFMLPVVP